MPKIKANGIELFYKESGQGEPLVLISGLAATHHAWDGVAEVLATKFRVIVFDNRGAGSSDCPNYPYTIDQMTNDVVGLCQALGCKRAHFIGNSMGGCIAQNLAYKFPQLVRSIVLCNTFPRINVRIRLWIESRGGMFGTNVPPDVLFKDVLPQLYSNAFLSRPGIVAQLLMLMQNSPPPITEVGYFNQRQALFDFNSSGWLSQISRPCLVLSGSDDILVDAEGDQQLAQQIQGAEFYRFQDVGHLPYVEQPQLFLQIVVAFLNKH